MQLYSFYRGENQGTNNLPKTKQPNNRRAATWAGLEVLFWNEIQTPLHAFGLSASSPLSPPGHHVLERGILSCHSPTMPGQFCLRNSAHFHHLKSPPLLVHMVTLTHLLSFCTKLCSSENVFLQCSSANFAAFSSLQSIYSANTLLQLKTTISAPLCAWLSSAL